MVATFAPPTPAAAPFAERRLVSILFADLVGFTAAMAASAGAGDRTSARV